MEEFLEKLIDELVIVQRTTCKTGGFSEPFDIVVGKLKSITARECTFAEQYLHIHKKPLSSGVVIFSVETQPNTAHLAFKDMKEDSFKEYNYENLKIMMSMHLGYSEEVEYKTVDEIIKKFFNKE